MSRRFVEKCMGVELSSKKNLLLECFGGLPLVDQELLFFCTEFLSARGKSVDDLPEIHRTPVLFPRPVDESVPKAIKRLSLSYPMLQDEELLHQRSTLMSKYILRGRAALT